MRIAFLDNAFHLKTRSSHFLVDALRDDFDVEVIYLNDDPRAQLKSVINDSFDIYICWQTEYVSPYLILKGKRVVCIPMFDGVVGVEDWYWGPMAQARYLNFSRTLHERHRSLGLDSEYFQYFGDDQIESDYLAPDFRELRGFFWMRRPDEGLDDHFAFSVIGKMLSSFHIHDAPDVAVGVELDPRLYDSRSTFEDDPGSYRRALSMSNVYLCPRRHEGIGLAMLEAMAEGKLVIANNAPTASEYIADGVNGILIDYDQPREIVVSTDDASRMASAARITIEEGRMRWKDQLSALLFFIESTPVPFVTSGQAKFADAYLEVTPLFLASHWRFMRALRREIRRGLSGVDFSTVPMIERVFWGFRDVPGVRFLGRQARRSASILRRFVAHL